jgi:hypothetical protein
MIHIRGTLSTLAAVAMLSYPSLASTPAWACDCTNCSAEHCSPGASPLIPRGPVTTDDYVPVPGHLITQTAPKGLTTQGDDKNSTAGPTTDKKGQ